MASEPKPLTTTGILGAPMASLPGNTTSEERQETIIVVGSDDRGDHNNTTHEERKKRDSVLAMPTVLHVDKIGDGFSTPGRSVSSRPSAAGGGGTDKDDSLASSNQIKPMNLRALRKPPGGKSPSVSTVDRSPLVGFCEPMSSTSGGSGILPPPIAPPAGPPSRSGNTASTANTPSSAIIGVGGLGQQQQYVDDSPLGMQPRQNLKSLKTPSEASMSRGSFMGDSIEYNPGTLLPEAMEQLGSMSLGGGGASMSGLPNAPNNSIRTPQGASLSLNLGTYLELQQSPQLLPPSLNDLRH